MKSSTIGKVLGVYVDGATKEKIEIRTMKDLKYVKHRMMRLKIQYPERFVK